MTWTIRLLKAGNDNTSGRFMILTRVGDFVTLVFSPVSLIFPFRLVRFAASRVLGPTEHDWTLGSFELAFCRPVDEARVWADARRSCELAFCGSDKEGREWAACRRSFELAFFRSDDEARFQVAICRRP